MESGHSVENTGFANSVNNDHVFGQAQVPVASLNRCPSADEVQVYGTTFDASASHVLRERARLQFNPELASLTLLRQRCACWVEAASLEAGYCDTAYALRFGEPVAFPVRKTPRLAVVRSEAGHEIIVDEGKRDGSKELVARVLVSRWRRSIATADEKEACGDDGKARSHGGKMSWLSNVRNGSKADIRERIGHIRQAAGDGRLMGASASRFPTQRTLLCYPVEARAPFPVGGWWESVCSPTDCAA